MGSRGSRDAVGVEPNAKRRCAREREGLCSETGWPGWDQALSRRARSFVRVVAFSSSLRRCVKPAVSRVMSPSVFA